MPKEALTKESLAEQVYNRLKHDITHRVMKPGEKIDINQLKDRFGVSQTPIREALLRLSQDGLVFFISNIGVEVVNLDRKMIMETADMLVMLDCKAIELAMQKDLPRLTEELEYHIKKHEESLHLEEEYWFHANQVHAVFYKYADNSLLNRMEAQIHALSDMIFGEFILSMEHRLKGIEGHKMILECVREKDVSKALDAMKRHWEVTVIELINP
jgi:Transcriptional regulators